FLAFKNPVSKAETGLKHASTRLFRWFRLFRLCIPRGLRRARGRARTSPLPKALFGGAVSSRNLQLVKLDVPREGRDAARLPTSRPSPRTQSPEPPREADTVRASWKYCLYLSLGLIAGPRAAEGPPWP